MANFDLYKPVATPFEVSPGDTVNISVSAKAYVAGYTTVHLAIYEGSWWITHGILLDTHQQTVWFNIGQTKTITFTHTAIEGTIDRRDVSVTMLDEFGILADQEWDDIFFVNPDRKVLEFEILGEVVGGSIIFNPPALDAEGHYYKGTVVSLTAVVNPGYIFVKWRGEVDNPLSTSLYNTVTMSENRLVKAEFAEEAPPSEAEFSGLITKVVPRQVAYGNPIDLNIDFRAYCETLAEQIGGWETRLTATLDSLSDSDNQTHFGREGHRTGETLNLGIMPARTLTGVITLEAKGLLDIQERWQELDRKTITITPTGVVPPPECLIDADCPPGYVCVNGVCIPREEVPPEEKEFPWAWMLIGGGGLVAVIGLASAYKEKR